MTCEHTVIYATKDGFRCSNCDEEFVAASRLEELERRYSDERIAHREQEQMLRSRLSSVAETAEVGLGHLSMTHSRAALQKIVEICGRGVERQKPGCDGKHGPPDCNDKLCWRGPIMNA
jgi:CDGSH-type Zn-finger protein